jgi:uncharacterized protein YjbJ (UPF0337 family)
MGMKSNVASEHETKKKAPMGKASVPKSSAVAFSAKLKDKIMSKWNRITEKDIDTMNGSFEMLATKIQEAYSYPKVKAERECEEFKKANKVQ